MQREGINAAKNEGAAFGRPKVPKSDNFEDITNKWRNGDITARGAMRILNLKPNTFYEMVK